MSREWENFCVGCPQGCINCGRKNDVLIITCDFCDEQIEDPDDALNFDNDNDMCPACHDKLEEALGQLDDALDTLQQFGVMRLGDREWHNRLTSIKAAIAELEEEV